ncbi:response regulator [Aliikangiella maris]|uniref:Response regulator n=2 Tax=Aliikangiella maris TaxID=3162458 RepID=A0ABV3MMW2_9GAMM
MTRQLNILLVEDNPGDIELVKIGLEETNADVNLTVIQDGQHALDHINDNETVPDIILLDINLPKVNGFDVLKAIRGSACYQMVPVIILTSSSAEVDIAKSYAEHANSYVTKPARFDNFVDVIRSIDSFWFTNASLPKDKLIKN